MKDKPDMKNFLFATAAALALLAAPAFAGPTQNITGCATAPAQGSNFTVFVDPTCPVAAKDSADTFTVLVNAVFQDFAEQAKRDREAAANQ